MPRDPRSFITVVDTMPEHPKVEGLSDAAFRLLIECWCWCRRQNNDGRFPAKTWARRGTADTRAELEAEGLVDLEGEWVQMHDYAEHQQTAGDRADLSTTRAEAGRKGGLAKAAKRLANASQVPDVPAPDPAPAGDTPDLATASNAPVATPSNNHGSTPETSKPVASASSKTKPALPEVEVEVEVEKDPPGGAAAPAKMDPERAAKNAGVLIGQWIDSLPTGRPPERVVGHVARELGTMLAEGIPYGDVRVGLQSWQSKGLSPAMLAAEVHLVRNPRTAHRPGAVGLDLDQARRDARARQELNQ